LNITVPHVGHLPLMALRPFFIVSSTASAISFLALHLTQYPSAIKSSCRNASCARQSRANLRGGAGLRQQGRTPLRSHLFGQKMVSRLWFKQQNQLVFAKIIKNRLIFLKIHWIFRDRGRIFRGQGQNSRGRTPDFSTFTSDF
jgi:hypothetical protein